MSEPVQDAALTPGVTLMRCTGCGTAYFPHRLICPKCGGAAFVPTTVKEAVVEETTCVRRAGGQADWAPTYLASVRTAEGQVLIVGLRGPVADGSRVKLYERDTAPYGRVE